MKYSMDKWLEEAKKKDNAKKCGMYLFHIGVVREDSIAKVRFGDEDASQVAGMDFDYDEEKVQNAVDEAYELEGIYYIRVWIAQGKLKIGDDIMRVLVGGDIRPHVLKGLEFLVDKLKKECVIEKELFS